MGWHEKEEMYSRRIFFAKTEHSLFRFTCAEDIAIKLR